MQLVHDDPPALIPFHLPLLFQDWQGLCPTILLVGLCCLFPSSALLRLVVVHAAGECRQNAGLSVLSFNLDMKRRCSLPSCYEVGRHIFQIFCLLNIILLLKEAVCLLTYVHHPWLST